MDIATVIAASGVRHDGPSVIMGEARWLPSGYRLGAHGVRGTLGAVLVCFPLKTVLKARGP